MDEGLALAAPDEWGPIPLKYLATFINGFGFKPDEWESTGLPIIRIQNLNGSADFNRSEDIPNPRYLVHHGDLLFSWSGNKGTSFGPFIWKGESPALLNQHIFRLDDFKVRKDWFYWALRAVTREIEEEAHGIIGMVHVTKADLGAFKVPVPPLENQRRIAAFLDRKTAAIDSLIAKKKRLITLLQEKRQALITHAVTKGLNPKAPMKDSGIPWIGEIPAHWKPCRLKHLMAQIADCPHSTPEYSDTGEFPAIRTADISPFVLNLDGARRVTKEVYAQRIDRMTPEPGDIVYSREGERFGMAALVPQGARVCLAQRVMVFRINKRQYGSFVMFLMNSKPFYEQVQQDTLGATSPRVNIPTILNAQVAMPPRGEQESIAAMATNLLGSTLQQESIIGLSVAKLTEYRQSLIAAAVTGQLSIPDEAA